jgi:hypothetical protein
VYKATLFPYKFGVALEEVEHGDELFSLVSGINQKFLLAQWAATDCSLPLRHKKDSELTVLLCLLDEANSLIAIEANPDSNFVLELMAFDDAFDAVDDCGHDAVLHHGHAEFDQNDDLYDICAFLHVEFVGYAEIQDTLSGQFGACYVYFVNFLVYAETKAAEVARDHFARAVELEVWICVTLAAVAAERSCQLDHADLVTGEGGHPECHWEGTLLDLAG